MKAVSSATPIIWESSRRERGGGEVEDIISRRDRHTPEVHSTLIV